MTLRMTPCRGSARGYAIIANPASGRMTIAQKRHALAEAAGILGAEIHGLNTRTSAEFGRCARQLARRYGVLVAAGGDGTFSEVINAVDTALTPVAYLPLGSGNALRHALGYRGGLADAALRIKHGRIREYDLIDCGGRRKAYNASIGIEGFILTLRDRYLAKGHRGVGAYARAVLRAFTMGLRRRAAEIVVDRRRIFVDNLVSLLIMKEPYYGYGMNMVPRACFDDGRLHVVSITSGPAGLVVIGAGAFLGGNRMGQYVSCRRLTARMDRPVVLQTDGNAAWESAEFVFTVLPKSLRIKC
jgi:diacylglycerol kinase (ATP)